MTTPNQTTLLLQIEKSRFLLQNQLIWISSPKTNWQIDSNRKSCSSAR